MSDKTPTRAEVINQALDLFAARLLVMRPAQIESIDTSTMLCSVKPLLMEMTNNVDGDDVAEPLSVVNGCVLFLPQGGEFVDTFPIQRGDPCWVIFSDRPLDRWQAGNGDTDPVFQFRHETGCSGLVLIGGRPAGKAITEFDTSRRVIGKQGGPRVAWSDTEIHLGVNHGESATDSVALATLVRNELTSLRNTVDALVIAHNTHTHPTAPPGPVSPPSSPATGPSPVNAMGSDILKAK